MLKLADNTASPPLHYPSGPGKRSWRLAEPLLPHQRDKEAKLPATGCKEGPTLLRRGQTHESTKLL